MRRIDTLTNTFDRNFVTAHTEPPAEVHIVNGLATVYRQRNCRRLSAWHSTVDIGCQTVCQRNAAPITIDAIEAVSFKLIILMPSPLRSTLTAQFQWQSLSGHIARMESKWQFARIGQHQRFGPFDLGRWPESKYTAETCWATVCFVGFLAGRLSAVFDNGGHCVSRMDNRSLDAGTLDCTLWIDTNSSLVTVWQTFAFRDHRRSGAV